MAGSSQYWHSGMRRRRRRKRTRPQGERFSWLVTPVPVLLPALNSSLAGVMSGFLGRCTPCFTCEDQLSALVTKSEVEECNHMRCVVACPLCCACTCVCVFVFI